MSVQVFWGFRVYRATYAKYERSRRKAGLTLRPGAGHVLLSRTQIHRPYLAVLGGADALVFGGGIGERAALIRARICEGMGWCGLRLDPLRNEAAVKVAPGNAIKINEAVAARLLCGGRR